MSGRSELKRAAESMREILAVVREQCDACETKITDCPFGRIGKIISRWVQRDSRPKMIVFMLEEEELEEEEDWTIENVVDWLREQDELDDPDEDELNGDDEGFEGT